MSAKNLLSPETLCLCKLMEDEEQILWQGKPQWSQINKFKMIFSIIIGIGLALCILVNFLLILSIQMLGIYLDSMMDVFMVSAPLLGLYLLIFIIPFSLYTGYDKLNYTDYFITPSKIIEMEVQEEKTNKIYCINHKEINEIVIESKKSGKGQTQSITFYSPKLKRFDNKENKWVSKKLRKSYIVFRYIPNKKDVFNILKRVIPKTIPLNDN